MGIIVNNSVSTSPTWADLEFQKIIPFILQVEGGYVNNPNDPGGATKYGITVRDNGAALAKMGIITIKDLTPQEASSIYYTKYWLNGQASKIPDIRLAYLYFDTEVNSGRGEADLILSRLSHNPTGFEGHGKNSEFFLQLCLEYVAQRLKFYTECRGAGVFLAGWVNRVVIDMTHLNQLAEYQASVPIT